MIITQMHIKFDTLTFDTEKHVIEIKIPQYDRFDHKYTDGRTKLDYLFAVWVSNGGQSYTNFTEFEETVRAAERGEINTWIIANILRDHKISGDELIEAVKECLITMGWEAYLYE